MNYEEAKKRVQARKQRTNYLVIKFGYDIKLVLPHSDGLAFVASMANAEQLNDPYSENHSISELDRTKMEISQMSQEEYEHYKIAALLGISTKEAKEAALNSG